jgi:hypothetical protein
MFYTPRGLDFFASLHLTIFERSVNLVATRRSNAVHNIQSSRCESAPVPLRQVVILKGEA